MKYQAIFICTFFYSGVFAQNETLSEFYLGDPRFTKKGAFIVSPEILENITFNEGLAAIKIIDTLQLPHSKKTGFINKKGKLIIPAKYDTLVSQFQAGVCKIKWAVVGMKKSGEEMCLGAINDKNEVLIDFSFKEIGSLNYSKVPVKHQNGWWSFINITSAGMFFTEMKFYKNIEYVQGPGFKVQNLNEWRIFNSKSDTVYYADNFIPFQYDSTISFSGGENLSSEKIEKRFIKVKEKNSYKIINKDGKVIVPAVYDSIYVSSEDSIFVVYKGKQMGIIDHDGSILLGMNQRYESFFGFVEGRARILKSGKFGYIDRRGNVRVAPQYVKAEDFSEGAAAVMINGKWGFIDKDENIIVQPHYNEVRPFRNGMALASSGGKWYFVNKEGKKVNSSPCDEIRVTNFNKWLLIKNNKYGLADINGRELLAPKYDQLEDYGDGFVKVKQNDKFGVLDHDQNFVVPIVYDEIVYHSSKKIFFVMIKGIEEIIEIK